MRLLISPETRAEFVHSFHPKTKQGLIRTAVVLVIAIVIISVLGFDIRAAVEHPQTQENFSFLGQFIADGWNNYLADYWAVVWNVVGPGWEIIWQALESFRWDDFNNQSQNFIDNAPAFEIR